jgi:hypothetical protein
VASGRDGGFSSPHVARQRRPGRQVASGPRQDQAVSVTAGEVVAAFAAAWNARDAEDRLRLLAASCTPDAVFVSPGAPALGTAALSESIEEFRRAFPASAVSFGIPDEHNGFVRVSWVTRFGNGRPPLAGEDFAQLAVDGRILLLVSFDGTAASPQAGANPARPVLTAADPVGPPAGEAISPRRRCIDMQLG